MPDGWNAVHDLPPCTPASTPDRARAALRVTIGATPDTLSRGGQRCGFRYVLRVPALHVEEELCNSACGPYRFKATRVPNGVAFECSADLDQAEGLVEFERGALVRRLWGRDSQTVKLEDGSSERRETLDWQAYALPCAARLQFESHSQAFEPNSNSSL